MPRTKLYALIWWPDGKKDIINLNKIKKSDRIIGGYTTLKWTDGKKSTSVKAKLIAIGESEQELERIRLTNDGVIVDASSKLFDADVIAHQAEMSQQEKMIVEIKQSNKKKVNNEILSASPIFPKTDSLAAKNRRKLPDKQSCTQTSGAYTQVEKTTANPQKAPRMVKTRTEIIRIPSKDKQLNQQVSLDDARSMSNSNADQQRNRFMDSTPPMYPRSLVAQSNQIAPSPSPWHQSGYIHDHYPFRRESDSSAHQSFEQTSGPTNYSFSEFGSYGSNHFSNPQIPQQFPRNDFPMSYQQWPPSYGPQMTYGPGMHPNNYHTAQQYPPSAAVYEAGSIGDCRNQYSTTQKSGDIAITKCNAPEKSEVAGWQGSRIFPPKEKLQTNLIQTVTNFGNTEVTLLEPVEDETASDGNENLGQNLSIIGECKRSQIHPNENCQVTSPPSNIPQAGSPGVLAKKQGEQLSQNLDESEKLDVPLELVVIDSRNKDDEELGSNHSGSGSTRYDDENRCDHTTDENDTEDDRTSEKENVDNEIVILASLLPRPVPQAVIDYHTKFLAAFNYNPANCDKKLPISEEKCERFKLKRIHYESGDRMKEIADGCGFYLHENILTYAQAAAVDQNDKFQWKNFVNRVLIETYGERLSDFCARGLRKGGRPGICKRLFTGMYKSVCKLVEKGEVIDMKDYVNYINKQASNKRQSAGNEVNESNSK